MALSLSQNSIFLSSIELLPTEVLILIFSKIDWRNLFNIKKVCKVFYTVIENNLKFLQKPRLRKLLINSITENDNICKTIFTFEYDKNKKISINNFNVNLSKTEKKIYEVEYLLGKMDFDNIDEININIHGNTIIFDILNCHLPSNLKIEELHIKIKNSPIFEGFIKFIEKIKYLNTMNLKHLCFGGQKIPFNYIFPKINGIEQLYVKECSKTKFFNIKMFENLFFSSENLSQFAIFSEIMNIEFSVIDAIRKKQDFEHKEKCKQVYYSIVLPYRIAMYTFEKLKNHYKENTLTFDEDLKIHDSIYVSTECRKCQTVDYIHFVYYRPEFYWESCC
ncbi:F-box domain-containing protein [Strongyloides ratti]|uniref:F-box domain-containing protein n=1 Tax=Strongyloides ratti TaxID=34506 RepID=A0A090LHF3_STRRB|nr:F-box domain-containing protein [Strongyloides ratti]CEF67583.1 F-box domain-containing protein [Strongyloides ratti]